MDFVVCICQRTGSIVILDHGNSGQEAGFVKSTIAMNSRRRFIRNTSLCAGAFSVPAFSVLTSNVAPMTPLKISLAQWSLHRALEAGTLKAGAFASVARNEFGITAVEYVNSFYKEPMLVEEGWAKEKPLTDMLMENTWKQHE